MAMGSTRRGREHAGEADGIVGQRIRALRKLRGMSQTTLGKTIGVSHEQIPKYEKGANRASPERLQSIAKVLGAPMKAFTEDLPPSSRLKPTELLAALRLPGAADLLALYAAIQGKSARQRAIRLSKVKSADERRLERSGILILDLAARPSRSFSPSAFVRSH